MPLAVGRYLAHLIHLLPRVNRLLCGSYQVVALVLDLLQCYHDQFKERENGQDLTSGGFPTGCIIFCHRRRSQQLVFHTTKADPSTV